MNLGLHYDYDNMEEMKGLTEPEETEFTIGVKQRAKDNVYGEDFKQFMMRRSERIAKISKI